MSLEFDIIFAGGGTTACVIAGRLIAADPSLKILIVESGQHSHDLPKHVQPCRYIENIQPNSTTLFSHISKPSTHLDGRAAVVRCGRAVGGGSVVNFLLYVRGAASDYDDWAALGNQGWSLNELLPLIRKLENFIPISDRQTHGYSGPIQVSAGGTDLGFGSQFLRVAREYDPTRPQVKDNNDFKTANAYSPAYRYVEPVTGKRSDAASQYLYPHLGNPNLQIVVGKRVKRVIIKDGCAIGIEYSTDGISWQEIDDEVTTVKATQLVVISAGTFGSPAILERSGIGSASVLKKSNVHALVDLPGVGENLQDHIGAFPAFYASDETKTMDDVWGDQEELNARIKEWEATGAGKIAHNGIEAMVKVRPTTDQLTSAGLALQLRWETFFQHSPDKPMGIIVPYSGFPLNHSVSLGRKLLSTMYYTLYPESTGSVHITSGEDANAPVDFDPNIFSKDGDAAQLTALYKMARELIRRLPAYRGEVAIYHPAFLPDSPAACRETEIPVVIDAPDIVYSDADNEAIAKFHRDTVSMAYHSLGTCAMKPRNQGGVVDARLNVYGVEGLKVADLSICPTNVGNLCHSLLPYMEAIFDSADYPFFGDQNTYSTALLIGEKAAAIIAQDFDVNRA